MYHAMSRRLRVWPLFKQTLAVFVARFGTLFPLAFVPSVLLGLLDQSLVGFYVPSAEIGEMPSLTLAGFAIVVASLVLTIVVQGVMCLAAVDAVIGREHSVMDYLRQTFRHLPALLVLGLLLGIAVSIGIVLFIVPGLYLAARFLPWIEAAVFENLGWSGLGRAQELTEDQRWPLARFLLLMVLCVLVVTLLSLPLEYIALPGVFVILIGGVFSALVYMLTALFTATAYARLREIRDGTSIADIARSIG